MGALKKGESEHPGQNECVRVGTVTWTTAAAVNFSTSSTMRTTLVSKQMRHASRKFEKGSCKDRSTGVFYLSNAPSLSWSIGRTVGSARMRHFRNDGFGTIFSWWPRTPLGLGL
jgi:hypothetical protein